MTAALALRPPTRPVEVIAAPNPFLTHRITMEMPEGATLEEMIRQAGVRPGLDARVFIERAGIVYGPISREWWPRIRPRQGSRVTIRAVRLGALEESGLAGARVLRAWED